MCRQCRRQEQSHRYVPRLRSSRVTLIYGLRPLRALSNASIYTRPEFPKMKVIGALAAALGMAGRHGTLLAATSIVVGLCHPGPCCGVQTLSRRSNRGHADACLSAGGSSRPARSLGATRTDCRCHRLDNADRPGRARHGVFGLPSWSTHAGSVFHAGAANVSARPDVFAGFRCLTRVGCGPNATLIISTAITPLTASFFTYIYLGTSVVSPLAFGLKLFLIIAGCALAATIIWRVTGQALLEAQRERIDGLSVLAMSTFAIAAMDGVVDHFRADLLLVIELVALAFALALGMIALAALVFCASDERALSQ